MTKSWLMSFAVAALAFAQTTALALGVFQIDGEIKAFDDKTLKVQTAQLIYEIKKSELNSEQLAYLKPLKRGARVQLNVATTALQSAKDVEKTK
jgi:hypothetical protein